MARPQPAFAAPAAYDPYLDLGRLLGRLEQNILKADSDRWRRLVGDEFQRMQAHFDVAAARSLLVRVEQDAAVKGGAAAARKQGELGRRRALVGRLQERLNDLDEEAAAATAADKDDDDDNSSLDDVLERVIQTPSESVNSQLVEEKVVEEKDAEVKEEVVRTASRRRPRRARPTQTATATTAPAATAAATPIPTVRRRIGTSPEKEATTTSSDAQSTGALRNSLLSGAGEADTKAVAAEEVLLDHHRREQEVLSEDILRLAQALKQRSLTTSRLLEDDKDVVDRVGEGLHTTNEHLSAASRSMTLLTRMTEGKGWWGRMLLFGMVYGLMLVLVLLFLFLPKLRL